MANIVSSVILTAYAQVDGRIWVNQKHTDVLGLEHTIVYLAAVDAVLTNDLAANATNLGLALAAQEVANNINSVATLGRYAVPTFNYSTTTDSIMAFRAAYLTMTQEMAIFTGDYFYIKVPAAGVQQAFGITLAAAQAMLTNVFAPQSAQAVAIWAAKGQ